VLFAYTDGLTEARGAVGMYGEQRLFARLAARAGMKPEGLVNGVMKDVLGFSSGLYDDVAVLAVQLRDGRRAEG